MSRWRHPLASIERIDWFETRERDDVEARLMSIEGLQLAHANDETLLEHGIAVFEALHRTFQQHERRSTTSRSRARATRRRRAARTGGRR